MDLNLNLNAVSVLLCVFVVALVDVVKRKVNAPAKPLITCVLDTLFYIPYFLEIGPWGEANDINTAIVKAIKATGLKDVGSSDDCMFMTRYNTARKVGLKNSRAVYSPTGYLMAESTIRKRMEVRLALVEYMKKHPAIADVNIKDPVFVIGFPRTGTTFLHECLGLYPGFRSHYTWEQIDTVPDTDDESIDALEASRMQKYKKNRSRFNMLMTLMGDSIQSVHRIGYDEPEECTTPCAVELPLAISELPYVAFACEEVIALGGGDAFDWYKKQLQLYTFQAKDRRDADFTWMLKCPFHLPYLSELHNTFPGSTVVWTHRDPCECIASCCSLYEHLMWATMEISSVDRKQLGKFVLLYTKLALKKAFASLKAEESTFKVEHIRYADTVKSPKEMCKNILAKVGLPFTEEYEKLLDRYLADNKAKREKAMKAKKTKSMHSYSLEDYGLSKEMIHEEFKDYIKEYNLSEKK